MPTLFQCEKRCLGQVLSSTTWYCPENRMTVIEWKLQGDRVLLNRRNVFQLILTSNRKWQQQISNAACFHPLAEPCKISDVQTYLTYKNSNFIWLNLLHFAILGLFSKFFSFKFFKKTHLFSMLISLLHLAINSMVQKKKAYIKTLCWNGLHFPQNRNENNLLYNYSQIQSWRPSLIHMSVV